MAMKGEEAYALSLGYTDDSIRGISGVLAGKNCVIKEIVDNKVTFQWTADDGTVRTNTMTVDATTPIDQIEDEVARWCEENKEDIKGQDGIDGIDGKTVQVLGDDETDDDIVDEAVLIFNPRELQIDENYSKAQADSRFAKRVDVGNVNSLAVSTWTDLVTAINDVYSKGMGAYRFECNEYAKTLTLICRNGVEVPIDISQIILNTNIEELKNMLVTNILDGQSLVYNASKKKWVNKSIDSSGVLVEAKQYTDDEIKKINNKGQIAVDGKPTYYGGVITYKKAGETKTTENTGTWFYYYDENDKAVQTIWIEGTEFTIAMAGDINLDDYIAKTEKIDTFDENFTDKTKVPTTRYIEELKEIIDDEIAEKINTSDIVDELNSDATDKPLSAKQGKELKSQIDRLIDDTADKTVEDKTYSAKKIAEAIDGVNPSWNGTKAEFEALDKSTLKDGQTVNITDDFNNQEVIDDSKTSGVSTWSSEKINDSLVDIWSAPTNENELGNWQQIQRGDISQSAENPFVMPYDGYFNFETGNDGMTIYFSDDGVTWFSNTIVGGGAFSGCQNMYFKKGTKIYRSGGNSYSKFFVAYFEKRNYTYR